MIIKTLPVGMLGTNCYLLCDETQNVCAVVDPGDEVNQIENVIAQTGCQLKAIYLTHGHYDHTDGVDELSSMHPGVPVYLHPKDGAEATDEMHLNMPRLKVPTVDYGEGDTLTLGSLSISVLSTPGHTLGSVVLQCEDALLAGDTLFAGSCGRTDLPGGNGYQMLDSLRRLANLPGDYTVYSGHGEASTMSRERRFNPFIRQAMQG